VDVSKLRLLGDSQGSSSIEHMGVSELRYLPAAALSRRTQAIF
jgi:hypothetical protein